jgi:acetylornithine deacetylase/succinyl-diaminopimelate desuccinylase-like protein
MTDMQAHIDQVWHDEIVPALHDYIRIPALSPAFDQQWAAHGHIDEAVELIRGWCATRNVAGLTVDVHRIEGRTPVIIMDVPAFPDPNAPGAADDPVLLYGHLDKQPEMTGWRDDLGPWKPVMEGDKLFGRGGADDGYAAYASLLAIEAAQAAGWAHHRCVLLIEACEESGSFDLPAHVEALRDRIGSPSLVICLDSGAADENRMWVTTSLRGMVACEMRIDILRDGVHSGMASGVVPSSFRIARQILDRIENSATGEVLLTELHVEIPADRLAQITETAALFPIGGTFPWVDGARPSTDDPVEQILRRSWRPTLSVTGVDGMPHVDVAGNVLRPFTSLRLSFRLPPTCDHERALAAVQRAVLDDPPYGARVQFLHGEAAAGWNAPTFAPWLTAAMDAASTEVFGNPTMAIGEGGTIPFMGMLGEQFPDAQMVVTGVLLPDSNAHGPNEYLHVPTGRKLTACVARLLRDHAARER